MGLVLVVLNIGLGAFVRIFIGGDLWIFKGVESLDIWYGRDISLRFKKREWAIKVR